MNGYAAKADANQKAIVKALRAVGAKVLSLHRVGGGVPDLLVEFPPGVMRLLEVKDGRKRPSARRLTQKQVEFSKTWTVHVVTCEADALKAIGLRVGGSQQ